MKNKKIIALVLAMIIILTSFVACSKSEPVSEEVKTTATQTTTAVATTQKGETTAVQKELTKTVSIKDEKGNSLNTTIIYSADCKEVLAGFVASASDKNGKALTKKDCPQLSQALKLAKKDKKYEFAVDKNKKQIGVLAYYDKTTKVVAMQDAFDVDSNKNTTELLQVGVNKDGLTCVQKDAKGGYLKVTATKDKSGKQFIVYADGKKVEATPTMTQKQGAKTTKKNGTTVKKEKTIILQKNGKAKSDAGKAVALKTGLVTITSAGDYIIKSETSGDWHGQIVIKLPNTAKANVRFENVKISYNKGNIIQIIDASIKNKRSFLEAETSSTDANDDAVEEIKEISDKDKAPNVDLSFPTNTTSTFTSSSNNFTGAIYNESKLTIKGNGKLNIKSVRNIESCLCSTKSVTFKNVTATLTTASNTVTEKISSAAGSAKGIFCYDKVNVESGKLNIATNGDAIRCDKIYVKGGTLIAKSSACDAIDADDVIDISGGRVEAYATEKSAFKARRVNASKTDPKKIRKVNGALKDYFKITKGTVIGESKKMSTPSVAGQGTVIAKIKKKANDPFADSTQAAANDDENRKQKITLVLGKSKTSKNLCTKMLYSDSTVKKGNKNYKAKSTYGTFDSQAWANNVCTIKIQSTK